jgi:hypothetical protein
VITEVRAIAQPPHYVWILSTIAQGVEAADLDGATGPLNFLRGDGLADEISLRVFVYEPCEQVGGFRFRSTTPHAPSNSIEGPGCIPGKAGMIHRLIPKSNSWVMRCYLAGLS